jgi:hypothetical protein
MKKGKGKIENERGESKDEPLRRVRLSTFSTFDFFSLFPEKENYEQATTRAQSGL